MNNIEWTARPACLYNSGVECERKSPCERCGWKPDVAARRIASIEAEARAAAESARSSGIMLIGGVSV